jgi:hypothetical protein
MNHAIETLKKVRTNIDFVIGKMEKGDLNSILDVYKMKKENYFILSHLGVQSEIRKKVMEEFNSIFKRLGYKLREGEDQIYIDKENDHIATMYLISRELHFIPREYNMIKQVLSIPTWIKDNTKHEEIELRLKEIRKENEPFKCIVDELSKYDFEVANYEQNVIFIPFEDRALSRNIASDLMLSDYFCQDCSLTEMMGKGGVVISLNYLMNHNHANPVLLYGFIHSISTKFVLSKDSIYFIGSNIELNQIKQSIFYNELITKIKTNRLLGLF